MHLNPQIILRSKTHSVMKNVTTIPATVPIPVVDLTGEKNKTGERDKRPATRDTADTDAGDCPAWYKVG